jgi:hypothetical protein
MSHFTSFLAGQLRAHPLLYPEPLDVMVAIFNGNSNMEWQKGNLVSLYQEARDISVMDYSDLIERHAPRPEDGPMKAFYASRWLEVQAKTQARNLVDQHMDIIVNADPTLTYFRSNFHHSGSIRDLINGETGAQPAFLHFPDDIQPDWGDAIVQFQNWLLLAMNNMHGVGIAGQTEHWPTAATALKEKINTARERLHPLLHNGQTYQEYCTQMQALSRRLVDDLLTGEGKDASTRVSRSRRPG